MDRPITRRDFCQGVAIGVGGIPLLGLGAGVRAAFADAEYYPPALTGLRGSHPGSFEVAHALAREGKVFERPDRQTDADYDLVVVGAGISGLASAHFYRSGRPGARILLLDNHDDFGGHAKRNEFTHDGKRLIGYGGSQSIDTPSRYSKVAMGLLRELGIDTQKFYKYFDRGFAGKYHLATGTFFDESRYGINRFVPGSGTGWNPLPDDIEHAAGAIPISDKARRDLVRLCTAQTDYLPDLDRDGKIDYLRKTSYDSFLVKDAAVDRQAADLFRRRLETYWGVLTESLSALEMYREGLPGFQGMGLGKVGGEDEYDDPYIFHFPDGNASIARLLVRGLVPGVGHGHTMEDVVTDHYNYAALDRPDNNVRIRLSSTVVNVQENGDGVDIVYVHGGETRRVRARNAVLACYHTMIPYLCPSLPETQKQAMRYQVKVPLVYTNVLISNWRALAKKGMLRAFCPASYFSFVEMDFPVSIGAYHYTRAPDQPVVVHMSRGYNAPDQGLTPQQQFRAGRGELLMTDFSKFEFEIRNQLAHLLGDAGFDPARDILAITVNRWPHGYAYEYIELFDPPWPPGQAPHEIARQPFGRIKIANADAEAHAYADAAIDAAHRAISQISSE